MKYSVKAYLNSRVPMRDGTELATHVYLPESEGPFPVLLVRTPYEAIGKGQGVLEWPERGYAHVVQDVRGRFLSDGDFYPWFNEKDDAEDTLDWLQKQPWCNGNVAMYGGSYLGATQTTAALTVHPALKCITPCLIGAEFYHTAYWGGAFRLSWQTSWTLSAKEDVEQKDIRAHLPLIESDLFAGEKEVPYWRDELAHPHYDDFWKTSSLAEHVQSTQAPAFIRTGWFDFFICDAFDLFNGMRKRCDNENVRNNTRMLVGSWPHNINQQVVGEEDFGENGAIQDLYEQEIAFIDYFTRGKECYDINVAPVKLFIMGRNEWRDEYEWPLARTVWTDFFLCSNGHANTAEGDGTLTDEPSGTDDCYEYNPVDPVPTLGGAWDFSNIGPFDQSEIEKRADVLVYTSAELEDDTEVTGPVEVKLFASSSAPDTDFTAKLVDLKPDDKAMSVTDGIIRARYRLQNGQEELLVPSEIYEFTIKCCPTAYVFKKGHRIRLEISSSNFPAFSRNLNTGNNIATDTEMTIAKQTIYHTKQYPSRIILPIIKNIH